jgi:hypothetical protein
MTAKIKISTKIGKIIDNVYFRVNNYVKERISVTSPLPSLVGEGKRRDF